MGETVTRNLKEEVDRVYSEFVNKLGKNEYTVYHYFGSGQEQLLLIIMMTMMTHQIGHNLSPATSALKKKC